MIRSLTLTQLAYFVISDALLVCGAMLLATYLRLNLEFGRIGPDAAFETPLLLYLAAAGLWLAAFSQAGVYRPFARMRHHLRRIITGHLLAALLFLGALYVAFRDYSRLQAFYFIVLSFAAVFLHRAITSLLFGRIERLIGRERRVLIVGVGDYAGRIGQRIMGYRWARLRLVGYLRSQPDEPISPIAAETLLGDLVSLHQLIDQERVDEVIICLKWFDDAVFEQVSQVVQRLQSRAVNIRLAPDYADLAYFHLSAEDFSGIPLIGVREAVLTPMQRFSKRLFDLLFSALVLALGWPLFLIIILAIRSDSPGPAIFRQVRVGQYGRPFMMLKFRTMYSTSERPGIAARKAPGDPRVTRVGRFLRRTSLDELPQFVNVLRGEMSLVGPRPELPERVANYEWWQRKRFELPQGMTGWWQVNGRADRPMHDNIEDDLYYISHYSLWLDAQIILRTILTVVGGRGAY